MIRKRATNIREVAAATDVSVATVSRALERPELVSEATRKRVYDAVRRLGYTPNAQARILRTARTGLVIAMVPDITNPFFAEVIRGIEEVAHANRYSVLLGDTQNSAAREQDYANLIATRRADGLITMLPHVPAIEAEGGLPVVNACEYVKSRSIGSVYVDNVLAAQTAVAYLTTLGHRHIAFVSGPHKRPICVDRAKGYRQALLQAGLPVNEALMAQGDFSFESGVRAVEDLLASRRKFTALFCSNDEMAIGAMRTLKLRGLRVPEDVSVVGFDDIRFARYTDPPLTTVAQPKREIGREAMGMLIGVLAKSGAPVSKRVLPTELLVRGSTAPPPRSSRQA